MEILFAQKGGEKGSLKADDAEGTVVKAGEFSVPLPGADGAPIAESIPIVRIKGGQLYMTVPEGAKGKVGDASFADLREAGKFKAQNGFELVPSGNEVIAAEYGDVVVKVKPGEIKAAASAPASKPAGQAPKAPAGGGGRPPVQAEEKHRNPLLMICFLLMFLIHGGAIGYLSFKEVPEDLYDDPTKIPDRFVKLIVDEPPEEEPEPEAVDEAPVEIPEEEAAEEGGDDSGDQEEAPESSPKTREEKREAVRSKGVLALITSSGGGGALSDVLSSNGLGEGLDSALNQVGGVETAGAGVEVRGARGGGGAGKAGIGNLKAGSGRSGGLGKKSSKKVVASIKTGDFEASGSLSSDVIKQVMKRAIRGIKLCYDKELAKDPKLKGKITVNFTIELDGTVKKYKIKSSTMNNATVEKCILSRIRRLKFPQPDKKPVPVNYPFFFTPGG